MKDVPLSFLQECFEYDPETGFIKWKKRPVSHFKNEGAAKTFNSGRAGLKAGSIATNGYEMLTVTTGGKYRFFYTHRVAWALFHDRMPTQEIDHANGVRTDNRICNLREADRLQNAANSVFNSQNKRGVRQRGNKWIAQMSFFSKNMYLGMYDTEKEAHAAFRGAVAVTRDPRFAKLEHLRD